MSYKIKPTKKQLIIMKLCWKLFQVEQTIFWKKIGKLEKEMSKKAGIPELEFFWCDNECVGIGDGNREMGLIHREKLE